MINIRLFIFESKLVTNLEFPNAVGVNFQYKLCSLPWNIGRSPTFRQDAVDDNMVGVDPKDSQIGPHEKHVDGSIEPGFVVFYQDQSFARLNLMPESKSS
jgi:hypothetical protein